MRGLGEDGGVKQTEHSQLMSYFVNFHSEYRKEIQGKREFKEKLNCVMCECAL